MTRRPDGSWKPNTAWIDGWDFRRVDDPQAQLAAARSGQTESVGITGDQMSEFENNRDWYILQWRNPTRECLLLNQTRDLYKDVRVRQAIWRAIDRPAIYDRVFAGLGIAGGPMTPAAVAWVLPDAEMQTLPGFKKDRNAELQEARQLLTAAGHPNGFEDVMTTVTAFSTNEEADLYVPQLQRIGIRYRLENVGTDFNTFLQREIRGEYSAAATLFLSGPYPDAQLNQYHVTGASRNYARYSDPKVDAMMKAQSQEFDIERRRGLVHEIQRELINNPPGFIWVGSRVNATAYRNYYKGFWVGNFLAGYPQAELGWLDR
jgi:peptide/nickel transport system substrate-binding protein